MGWDQRLDIVDAAFTGPAIVRKKVWNGTEFVDMKLCRQRGIPNSDMLAWLNKSFGSPGTYKQGQYWEYSITGNFTVMDERLYTWYQLKLGK